MAARRRVAGVHQHEAAGAIGILDHAAAVAGLAEGGGLLVAGDARDRDRTAEPGGVGDADLAAAGHDFGQHRGRDAEQVQQFVVPAQAVDIEEHGAGGVAGVGDVAPAQFIGEPAVDGAEGQFAALGAHAGARDVGEQPFELGRGKIGVEFEAGLALDEGGVPGGAQCVAAFGGAAVLPDDGVTQWLAAAAVPHHRRFALVGDADGGDFAGAGAALLQHFARAGELGVPDVERIVLDPAGLGKMLGIFLLGERHDLALAVEQDGTRTGGALVEGKDVKAHHRLRPL